jgi:hypothetical protein
MGPPNGVLQGGSKVLPTGVRARDVARALVGTEAFEESRRDRTPGAALAQRQDFLRSLFAATHQSGAGDQGRRTCLWAE